MAENKWFRYVVATVVGLILVLGVLCHNSTRPREMAARAACESHLRKVFDGIEAYRAAHEEQYPTGLDDLYPQYVPSQEWLACAVVPRRPFAYARPSGFSTGDSILAYDESDRHRTDHGVGVRPCVMVLLRDGNIVQMDPDVFRTRLREQLSTRGGACKGSSWQGNLV